nr:heat shock 70 kDa protein 16-like [Tanacetum cinerariifolium]
GAAFATANPKSTISQIKRLIGMQYKELSVQEELKLLPFVTKEGPRGGILIELEYLKEKMMFTPVEILGMLFKHLKHIAEKNLESAVVDCVIGIPSLRASCEKLKKVLSANTEAPLSIECLIEDNDVKGIITREEFENLSQHLLERVTIPCLKAVEDSGISVDKIYTIELVG